MKISVKSRYGLSAMICLSQNFHSGECTTIIKLADKLKLSKIYLEQVFSLLKRSGLVIATKGAQGGYQLARAPRDITVYDVLSAIEISMFETTEATVPETEPEIEKAMQNMIFNKLGAGIAEILSGITLDDLTEDIKKQISDDGYMYYL